MTQGEGVQSALKTSLEHLRAIGADMVIPSVSVGEMPEIKIDREGWKAEFGRLISELS